MKFNKIVLYPTQGFGNRIKAITSAKVLADYLNITLHINWSKEDCINAEYNDIFSDDPNSISEDIFGRQSYIFKPNTHVEETLIKIKKNNICVETLVIQGGHCFKHFDMSTSEFIKRKHEVSKNLKWKKEILEKVEHLNIKENTIGLHIRRFVRKYDEEDNKKSKMFEQFKCELIFYFIIIDKILRTNKDTDITIFCCSNYNTVKQEINNKYKEHVIIHDNTSFDRSRNEDVINSVVDFIALSRCDLIIGAYFSSFSDEACFINLVPKVCVSDKEELLEYHTNGYDKKFKTLIPSHNKLFNFLI